MAADKSQVTVKPHLKHELAYSSLSLSLSVICVLLCFHLSSTTAARKEKRKVKKKKKNSALSIIVITLVLVPQNFLIKEIKQSPDLSVHQLNQPNQSIMATPDIMEREQDFLLSPPLLDPSKGSFFSFMALFCNTQIVFLDIFCTRVYM